MEAFGTNAGEPPPRWRLNYKIGSGSFGTVFLEKVLARGMESPELWAVKRISRTLPNFPAKRYQAEMQNLRVLSKVNLSRNLCHYITRVVSVIFIKGGFV